MFYFSLNFSEKFIFKVFQQIIVNKRRVRVMVFNATFNNISVKEGILKINLKFKKPIKIELKKKIIKIGC
jgi:hypothetical protein